MMSFSRFSTRRVVKSSCLILAALSYSQSFVNGKVFRCLEISLSKEQNPRLNEAAAFTLANLATELTDMIDSDMIEALVQSLSKDNNITLQEQAARALANLAYEDQGVHKINLETVDSPNLLERLVCSLSKRDNPRLQAEAAEALSYLAHGDDEIRHRIVDVPGALRELVNSLYGMDNPRLQCAAARTLFRIAAGIASTRAEEVEYIRMAFFNTPNFQYGITRLLASHISPITQGFAVGAMTLIYPTLGNQELLQSASAYSKRGDANMRLGKYTDSQWDLEKANNLQRGDAFTLRLGKILKRKIRASLPGVQADVNEELDMVADDFEPLRVLRLKRHRIGERGL